MEQTTSLPISKLSYSSLTLLLRNPMIFKMQEVFGVYQRKSGLNGMIGKAGHEALKVYYGGRPELQQPADLNERRALAKEFGLLYLAQQNDEFIHYGKTGSREKMLAGYTQAMDLYFAEEPEYHKILICEEKLEGEMTSIYGDVLPLPAVGIPDLVHERPDGKVEIVDVKFVTAFTDYETEDYLKIMQAQFLDHLLRSAKGIQADRVLFREVKRTKNADGTQQIRDYAIPLDHEPYRVFFYNLYRDVVKFLSSDPIFLPNIGDPLDGEEAGLIYAQGLISADMSDVEVMHKVRDVAFTSKKFVASRLDSAINKNLLPEEKVKVRLAEFGIPVEPVETKVGATVTQYRFKVSAGIRMSTVLKHKDDIARALEAKGDVRVLAPIRGTALIGVEVENTDRTAIRLAEEHLKPGTLSVPVGVDVSGENICVPLGDMPHLLVAGSTGSGKSVFLNTLINALSKQLPPDQLEMILIDPKRVELSAFSTLPHLQGKPVIYEYDDAVRALLGLADEMDRRYKLIEASKKRDITEYNKARRDAKNRLPYIVAVVDEFADLMMLSKLKATKQKSYSSRSKPWLLREIRKRDLGLSFSGRITKALLVDTLDEDDLKNEMKRPDADVELLLVRLAQMARATGIHLVIATQRPSVDVITGLIKANFPTRVALTTASPTDSTVILGTTGAERLSGKGDMLFMSPSVKGLVRLQAYC
jgi:hypothetical protein